VAIITPTIVREEMYQTTKDIDAGELATAGELAIVLETMLQPT
jgi:hypothetical protein